MSSHTVTPGPYRATKLWNEVTKLFRAGMPLKKHRQHFRLHANCFSASAAVDWLHELLKSNCNFGPDVTRQQTVQLMKKFLKNHVIEDLKGRWGFEDFEDNGQLYRFPSTSPLKAIPNPATVVRKKSMSLMDRDSFFKFRGTKKCGKEALQENVDPEAETGCGEAESSRQLTEEDVLVIWKNVTLTQLQKLVGEGSLEDVLDPAQVNPQFIVHNMTKVNKHGVVSLEDKTADLPHWVLSAMKCLANWPQSDSGQSSYPGFERDVFKTISDYFYSLSQPLLTYHYYQLFVNILVMCGYVTAPKTQCGKRKSREEPNCPQPAKAANLFKSTECLLLSLIRKEAYEEAESPMRDVFGSRVQKMLDARVKRPVLRGRRASEGDGLDEGPTSAESEGQLCRLQSRSCSPEGASDELFRPSDNPQSRRSDDAEDSSPPLSSSAFNTINQSFQPYSNLRQNSLRPMRSRPRSVGSLLDIKETGGISQSSQPSDSSQTHQRSTIVRPKSIGNLFDLEENKETEPSYLYQAKQRPPKPLLDMTQRLQARSDLRRSHQRSSKVRPRSMANLLDIEENQEVSASSFSVRPDSSSSADLRGGCGEVRAGPGLSRRSQSSVDLNLHRLSPEQTLLHPSLEGSAVEALQLCTLLLPPANRRHLQLLLRMMSRMSQNVDMPRLHHVIATRTLLVQTFSRCVLSCEEVDDLDELLATRLLSFLMDHQQEVMRVPLYLLNAVEDHLSYLRSLSSCPAPGVSTQTFSFCRQISAQEFEEQKLSLSQAALADLLEELLKDRSMSLKEKKKKLKLFQKEYPDIYTRRFPTTESEARLFTDKPKIKPPMLLGIKRAKTFSIRN